MTRLPLTRSSIERMARMNRIRKTIGWLLVAANALIALLWGIDMATGGPADRWYAMLPLLAVTAFLVRTLKT
jgi:4-hydroxybenzoate polyprenyltransferase